MNPSSSQRRSTATRTQILDAAERLFAENGAHRTSVRAITRAAHANIGAVNYHFGSKDQLVQEVLTRRLAPLNRKRLQLLDAACSTPHPALLTDILRAFVTPALEMVRQQDGGSEFARFLARSLSEPDDDIRSLILAEFAEVIDRFTAALKEALPSLEPADVHWRLHFMVGSLIHTLGFGFLAHRTSHGLCDPTDLDALSDQLVTFLGGGFRAARPGGGE